MTQRKDYYKHVKSADFKPFETQAKFDHLGDPIPIPDIEVLKEVAHDYLCTRRGGAHYHAFEVTLRLIDTVKKQSEAIDRLRDSFTVM